MIYKRVYFLLGTFYHIFPNISPLSRNQTTQFVSDYFQSRGISSLICYTCSYEESLHLVQLLTRNFLTLTINANYEDNNLSKLTNHFQSSPNRIGIYVNHTCSRSRQLLKQISDKEIFQRKHKWLVWTRQKQKTVEDFMNYKMNVFCDITIATENERYVNLYIIYKVDYSVKGLKEILIGFWNEETGLRVQVSGTKVERRSNLEGILVKSQTVFPSLRLNTTDEDWLQLAMNNSHEKYKDNLSRYTIVLFTNLAKLYNFTLDISIADEFGIKERNGEYSGLIGAIENNKTDIGLTGFEKERSIPFLDYTVLLWRARPIFIFRSHKPFDSAYSLGLPFSSFTWLCICIMLGFIALALVTARQFNSGSNSEDCSLSGSFLVAIATFCQQGFESCSSRLSERIILLTALIFGLIICTFYNSIFVTLALKRKWVTVHNAEDLMISDMKIGICNENFFKDYFESSNNSLVSQLYKKKIKGQKNSYVSEAKGLELVHTSNFAFYGRQHVLYKTIIEKFSMNEICQLSEVEFVEPFQVPSPMRKDFFLKEFINCGLVRLKEIGVVARELSIWYPVKPHCQASPHLPSVSVDSLIIAYAIYYSGLVMSVAIMFIEIYISNRR